MKIEVAFLEIEGFVDLSDNWDGYGAVPLCKPIATKAKEFLLEIQEFVEYIDDIYPNPHGTLTIEFLNKEKDIKLSMEIGLTKYSYFTTETPHKLYDSERSLMDELNYIKSELLRILK